MSVPSSQIHNNTNTTNTTSDEPIRPVGKNEIQLYSLGTPNGHKISIMLEELAEVAGVKYDAHTVDISKNEQFSTWFKEINPNSKIPALIDRNGPNGESIKIFESGAILLYLGEKYGKFLPTDIIKKYQVIEWLFWQMAGFGPMLGQMGHFHKYAKEDVPYAKERYLKEAQRLFQVLDKQLQGRDYVCDEYSIADMAIYPWARGVREFYQKLDAMGNIPNVARWMERIESRPAVKRGLTVNPM